MSNRNRSRNRNKRKRLPTAQAGVFASAGRPLSEVAEVHVFGKCVSWTYFRSVVRNCERVHR